MLNLIPTLKIAPKQGQKIAPKSPKKVKTGAIRAVLETKDNAVLPKPKLVVYISRAQKKILILTPAPKLALYGPKNAKRQNTNQKYWAVLRKPKFILHIWWSEKCF